MHPIWPNWESNSWPQDDNSAFHVTEMFATITQPSVTSYSNYDLIDRTVTKIP